MVALKTIISRASHGECETPVMGVQLREDGMNVAQEWFKLDETKRNWYDEDQGRVTKHLIQLFRPPRYIRDWCAEDFQSGRIFEQCEAARREIFPVCNWDENNEENMKMCGRVSQGCERDALHAADSVVNAAVSVGRLLLQASVLCLKV